MIIYYGQFGDVVSFDTTYKINKENWPFAVFVGLNHHREIVTFGAVLLYDETVDSFIWLFETFFSGYVWKGSKNNFHRSGCYNGQSYLKCHAKYIS